MHYLTLYNLNLEVIAKHPVSLPNETALETMILLSNNKLAIAGSNANSKQGFLGAIDLKGNLQWHKLFSDWQFFNKLILNRNNFFAIGQNTDRDIGFIEINANGTEYADNRFPNAYTNISSLDVLSDSLLILTYFFNDSPRLYISKYQYKPLFQDTSSIIDSTIGGPLVILPVPNPANNTISLQFADMQTVHSVIVYDYSGIEVMRIDYPVSPIFEVTLPIHSLSIGIYHATVTTASGILRTRFIKY